MHISAGAYSMTSPALGRAFLAVLLCGAALGLAALGGCGGDGDRGALLAKVGDVEIRVADYEERLGALEQKELPRDAMSRYLDMAAMEGKQEFLTTLINKELMVAKAHELGYAVDANVLNARKSLTAYEANITMAMEVLDSRIEPTGDEDFARYYKYMGEMRNCSYLVTNYEQEALAAREAALGGMDWDEVIETYHEGTVPKTGELSISVPYGRYDEDFEAAVFDAEVGGYSQPVETAYGWWLLRVEDVETTELPPLEEMKGRIDNVHFNRQKSKAQKEFRASTREKHNAVINEEALWKVFQGLPENEVLIDPETNEPPPESELEPLRVEPADLDLVLFSYDIEDGNHQYTVADYKEYFDGMSTFARPKKEHMVTGLRHKIQSEFERAILADEAKQQGYFEHPDVVAKVDRKVEEIMVTNLYNDLVVFDKRITPEDMQAYWDEHAEAFATPEKRTGRLVIAEDEASAAAARGQLLDGAFWRDIVAEYGTEPNNQRMGGKLSEVAKTATGPVADMLFSLEVDQLSEPFDVGDGRYAVVRCDKIVPEIAGDMLEARQRVGAAIRGERKEAVFQQLLGRWTEEIGVTRYDENLSEVRSWEELTREAAEN